MNQNQMEQIVEEYKKKGCLKEITAMIPKGEKEMRVVNASYYEEIPGKPTGSISDTVFTGMKFEMNPKTHVIECTGTSVHSWKFHPPAFKFEKPIKIQERESSTIVIESGTSTFSFDNKSGVRKVDISTFQMNDVTSRLFAKGYKHTIPYQVGEIENQKPFQRYLTTHGIFVLYPNDSYIIYNHISPEKECGTFDGNKWFTFESFLFLHGIKVNSTEKF
jgi:hypothetical protein